jgi:hypothetical protein
MPSFMNRSCRRQTQVFDFAGPAHDLVGANTVGAQQDDRRPPSVFLRGVTVPGDRFESAADGPRDRDGVRRQRSLDRTGGLNKGEFLAHRNVHRSEDETANPTIEGTGDRLARPARSRERQTAPVLGGRMLFYVRRQTGAEGSFEWYVLNGHTRRRASKFFPTRAAAAAERAKLQVKPDLAKEQVLKRTP